MDNQQLPVGFEKGETEFLIPKFGGRPPVSISFTKIVRGENRLHESQAVNGATYSELEYVFNESYREAKQNISVIGYEITQTQKALRKLKSYYILDEYPDFLKERKLKDNASNRDGFLEKQRLYVEAHDRLDMLTALLSLVEGKIKVFENTCRYMRKEMDILVRSGMTNNKYSS